MLFRRLLLALGVVALLGGIALAVISLRQPRNIATGPVVPKAQVLTAAKDVPQAALLRSDDIKWAEIPVNEVPAGALVRAQGGPEPEILGAATRRGFKTGEVIAGDMIIRPSEAGFLTAVLHPGMRAIALSIDAAAVGAGLIQPGDHVDVLLTQGLGHVAGNTELGPAFRSVGETILRDLRVIAVDQTTNLAAKPGVLAQPTARVPQTVTLEVSAEQAQALLVARQLGSLQLSLRSLADAASAPNTPLPRPTWAIQVSQALRELSGEAAPGEAPANGGEAKTVAGGETRGPGPGLTPASQTAPVAVDVIRGTKPKDLAPRIEQNCFSEKAHTKIECPKVISAPGTEASPGSEAEPAGTPGAAPGKASALSPAPTARRAA